MWSFLDHHTDIAILIILFLEDLGIPMPIPADVIIMYAGYRIQRHTLNPVFTIMLMLLAVNTGATILYTVVRKGGRPLVDRFGRYIHLKPEHLARIEARLNRRQSTAIIIGRALPGIRLATVIGAGLFNVPYRVFAPSQLLGTLIYMIVFLLLGYFVGPQAVERLRLPATSLRLILLIITAFLIPLVLRHLNRSTASDDTGTIEATAIPRQRRAAAIFGGFLGLLELTTVWAIAASASNIHNTDGFRRTAMFLGRLLFVNRIRPNVTVAYSIDYLLVALVCVCAPVLFFELAMPRFHLRPRRLGQQALILWLEMIAFAAVPIGGSILFQAGLRARTPVLWFTPTGRAVLGILIFSLLAYAYVVVNTRRLAIDRLSEDPRVAPSAAAEGTAETSDQPRVTATPSAGSHPNTLA
ncbi:MAG: hypothetical protein NVSMB42_20200 [Herpetosiphon sp.]